MNSDYSAYIYYKKEDGKIKSYVLRENGENKKEVILPSKFQVYNTVDIIKFLPSGKLIDKGETISIIDMNNEKKREITIVPFSGRVLVKENIYSN